MTPRERLNASKTPRARLDADRTAQPKTRLLGHGKAGHCLGPENVPADTLENVETGERTPLIHSRRPQAQNSLTEQLQELIPVANKLGLYDAADFLTRFTEGKDL
jgi:hypothetical protein